MDFLHRLLGLLAFLANRSHRDRRNLVPQSVVPFIGWVFLPVFVLGWLQDLGESKTPFPASVAEIVAANEVTPHRFVTLTGRYHPDFTLISEAAAPREIDESDEGPKAYVAFIDPKAHAAVMVQMSPAEAEAVDTKPVTVTGMLRYGEPPLRKKLPEKLLGMPLSHYQYLQAGAAPERVFELGPVALLLLFPLALYTVAFCRGAVIFRREKAPASLPPPTAALDHRADVRATGRFFLEGCGQERFVQVPANLTPADDGGIAVYAYVDASRTRSFYFITYSREERIGHWLLWIGNGTVKNLELGTQYFGWSARPALRCRYSHPSYRLAETVVLSFDSVAARAAALAELQGRTVR